LGHFPAILESTSGTFCFVFAGITDYFRFDKRWQGFDHYVYRKPHICTHSPGKTANRYGGDF
jgi:hypothetical protein